MRLVLVVACVVFASTAGFAQPGPYAPPPGPYAPGGPPGANVPPPYAYQPRQPPTPEEQALLDGGYISDGQVIGGGLAAIFLGFGIGQGIEGRWHERGWIFTLGESLAAAGMIGGAMSALAYSCVGGADPSDCSGSQGTEQFGIGLVILSAIALTGFRVWEIADAFIGPAGHNDRVRALRERYGYRDPIYTRITPYISRPQSTDGGMTFGLSLRF